MINLSYKLIYKLVMTIQIHFNTKILYIYEHKLTKTKVEKS